MKRSLVALLLVVALVAPAFGQESGGSAVIRSDIPQFDAGIGLLKVSLPSSLLSIVSNGIYRDEIDEVVLNPLGLANYSGYTLWTAYGNFEFFNRTQNDPIPLANRIQPFTTTALNDGNIGNFQLGAAFPLPFGWRAGVLSGTQYTKAGNIDLGIDGIVMSAESKITEVTDVGTVAGDATGKLGTPTYTEVTTTTAKDETLRSSFRIGAGLHLGFMALSAYAFSETSARSVGGSYDYAWTKGTDTYQPFQETTAEKALYGPKAFGTDAAGTKAEGKPGNWPNDSTSIFGAIAQLPLNLFGLALPVTANLNFITQSGFAGDELPVRYTVNTAYDQVINEAGKTSSYTWTGSEDISVAWNVASPGAVDYTPALVVDPTNSGFGLFKTSIGAAIDPVLSMDGPLTIKPRFGFKYQLTAENQKISGLAYAQTSESNAGASVANSSWLYSRNETRDGATNANLLAFSFGSLFDFKNADDSFGLAFGAYVTPFAELSSAKIKSASTTTSSSWKDEAAVNEATYAILALELDNYDRFDRIAKGDLEGSATLTSTETYTGGDTTNVLGTILHIPVSARLNLFKGKLQLVGGYEIEHQNVVTYFKEGTNRALTETLIIKDSAGTVVYDSAKLGGDPSAQAAPVSTASKTEEGSFWSSAVNQTWNGSMGFMFRWFATDNITVDLSGSSVKTAFVAMDGIFSLNNGLQPSRFWNFIDALQMSVTFRF